MARIYILDNDCGDTHRIPQQLQQVLIIEMYRNKDCIIYYLSHD